MNHALDYHAIRSEAGVYARGTRIVELTGRDRQRLLEHVVARSTEYSQPGTVLDSLVLDDDGRPIDLILVVTDEHRVILLSDEAPSAGVLGELESIASDLGLQDVGITHRPDLSAVAVEGPLAWKVVGPLLDEDVAGLLLGEWRTAAIPGSQARAVIARTGTTAEYGYVVVAELAPEELASWIGGLAEAVGGRLVDQSAVVRARMEVDHPLLAGQFDGISVREAGAGWLAGAGRSDSYRGRTDDEGELSRRLTAVVSDDDLHPGGEVRAGDVVVGRIQVVAPRAGQATVFALALLNRPFDVPGLVLDCGAEIRTVARPAVEPQSWVTPIS
ncbi:aminomethyl transferase family protein [Leifsonia sp. McL0607]|uniref:aminomethyl transferase family protein n=1 Tax=Leifsonia sp. McL0607 TaxID=3415672 RepID=UPI003CF643B0